MVESDTLLACSFLLLTILILLRVGASNKIALVRILNQFFEELSALDTSLHLRGSQVKLLTDATRNVDHADGHGAAVNHFIVAMKLGIGLLDQGNPKFLGLRRVRI